jgi:lysophospholipase L1-like esterase
MIKGFIYFTIFAFLLVSAHFNSEITRMKEVRVINYLPVGDSYTIGTGASEKEAWPALLVYDLNENKIRVRLLDNPARNGFSTSDLIEEELPVFRKTKPDFVSLQIGVNDWVRGVSVSSFHKNLIYILDELQKELQDKRKLILITIPDFGVTPTGKNYSRGRDISLGIKEFNAIIESEAKKRNLPLVDVFEISKEMGKDLSLVAKDGLHPSAKEYAIWEKLILPEALKLVQ